MAEFLAPGWSPDERGDIEDSSPQSDVITQKIPVQREWTDLEKAKYHGFSTVKQFRKAVPAIYEEVV